MKGNNVYYLKFQESQPFFSSVCASKSWLMNGFKMNNHVVSVLMHAFTLEDTKKVFVNEHSNF